MKKIITADLFCGAGGASTGLHMACKSLGLQIKNYCINHWDIAIDSHKANYPEDIDKCAGIETVIPSEFVKEGYLDILWASPSCTHHSRAKGGKPRDNQLRAQPNLILDWLDMLHVRRVIIENVEEFSKWGPLTRNGSPMKNKAGTLFNVWVASIEARGYKVEWRILNCADYGDATTRKRFFLQAVKRGCGKITWPEATYAQEPQEDFFRNPLKRWKGIGECLDLSDIGRPISQRKKPLAPATMRRIAEGIRRFHGERFVMDFLGSDRPVDETRIRDLGQPLATQPCSNRFGVATPFVVDFLRNGSASGLEEPIRTQHCKSRFGLATPFITKWERNAKPIGLDEPISTQTSAPKFTLGTPIMIRMAYGGKVTSADDPIPTMTTRNNLCMATPILIDTANGGKVRGVDAPMPTLTAKNSMCLASPLTDGYKLVDVCFRMLKPNELKLATGFPKEYVLCGNDTEKVKQIGNAVPASTAMSLAIEALRARA